MPKLGFKIAKWFSFAASLTSSALMKLNFRTIRQEMGVQGKIDLI